MGLVTQQDAVVSPSVPLASAVQISVVVPVFNECENIPELYRRLSSILSDLASEYELLFVDDGSRDRTPWMLEELAARNPNVGVLHLSRNFGHQAALTAGLEYARGEAVIVLDGDLQDPPELIPQLLERWREGYDVVFAVRAKRKENLLKRLGYFVFYRLLRGVSDVEVPLDAGDFCLMDQRVLQALNRLPERGRFIRGLRAFLGFRQTGVPYERDARHAGKPKYTLRKLFGLALDGVFNFSTFPVRIMLGLAGLCGMAALVAGVVALFGEIPQGWLAALVLALGSLNFACLSGLGLYLHKVLTEVRGRPVYIMDRFQRPRT